MDGAAKSGLRGPRRFRKKIDWRFVAATNAGPHGQRLPSRAPKNPRRVSSGQATRRRQECWYKQLVGLANRMWFSK